MRAVLPAVLLAALVATGALAQDALRGKRLYHDIGRLSGAGVSCIDCHGGIPGALHGLERAAGNPDHIAYALGAVQQMTPLRGRVSAQDRADLAAYIALPRVASPEPRLTTAGPAANAYSAERLEFPDARAGTTSPKSAVRLTNQGAMPLLLLSAPALDGPDAAQFAIVATDCTAGLSLAAGQTCGLEIVFTPRGPAGLRSASAGLSHDWIGGGFRVALIGRVR
jgi:cytochrome c553